MRVKNEREIMKYEINQTGKNKWSILNKKTRRYVLINGTRNEAEIKLKELEASK